MLIDTHAHINFNAFREDGDEVIRRALDNNIWMINVGSQYSTSKRAVEIAQKYKKAVFAAVGLHPIHLNSGIFKTTVDKEEIEFETKEEDFDYYKYKELAKQEKAVAIGEVGLDYYYKPKTKRKLELFKEKQKQILLKQLDLAKELNLPVIFHCRSAHNDLIDIITRHNTQNKELRGVIHCFSGAWREAKEYLAMGFYLGFNGIIFKMDLKEVIEKLPPEKILLETDCPYLTPPPTAGRNEPIYVKYVAERIGKIKNMSQEEISEITTQNARKLFRI